MSKKLLIVGAGPGDPELLTIKALNAIKKAEFIFYDRSITQEILSLVPEKAEKGKISYYGKSQDERKKEYQRVIDQVLLGKKVIHLKQGDPTVFHKIEMETDLLKANGVEFSFIPGLSSGLLLATAAKVSLTDPVEGKFINFLAPYSRKKKKVLLDDEDYHYYATHKGTLVFYLSIDAFKEISAKLIEKGMDPSTSAIYGGELCRPSQRLIFSTVEELPKILEKEDVSPLAIIAIGNSLKSLN